MRVQAKWICPGVDMGDVCPVFRKEWEYRGNIEKAELLVTADGVYEARLNGERVGEYVLAPGWTSYETRLQYQIYDITGMLKEKNCLEITVGKGWARSPMPGFADNEEKQRRMAAPAGLLAQIRIRDRSGREVILGTDGSWEYAESPVRFSEIYDGESYDAGFCPEEWKCAVESGKDCGNLIPQEGEEIREMERVQAKRVFRTPAGETVVDFGQEVTGYPEFSVTAVKGDRIHILHGEVLDADGNFYRDNYRGAKAEIIYLCRDGFQTWHPRLTFFGFRYLKLEEFPGEAKPEQFTAIAVYSNMRQTGQLRCGVPLLNQLFSNIFWGQKGNFLDVPTDCPQRDERLGWTGDAQVFVKTASYNFDVEKFFAKWLHDLAADQFENGAVGHVVPDYLQNREPSAAWGDAAVICPWQIYQTYGDPKILRDQFESMKKWVDYITAATATPKLWTGGSHYGDWLGLDAPSGSYKGSSNEDLIASAFYARSTELLIQAGCVIGEDMSAYEQLYREIVKTFRETYPVYRTQTEYTVAIWFGLAPDREKAAKELADLVRKDGCQLRTGFVGTPYLLHVLSSYGYTELAYTLLLRTEYPSWLYPVTKGATTIWEHWDGIMQDGGFWSADMNSFNHYAYGSVADWVYEEAAGIRPMEPGFARVQIAPKPDERMGWLDVSVQTRNGKVRSVWTVTESGVRYEIETEMPAKIVTEGTIREVPAGSYTFWEDRM